MRRYNRRPSSRAPKRTAVVSGKVSRPRRGVRKPKYVRASPLLAKAINGVIKRNEETKYVAEDLAYDANILGFLDGVFPNNRLFTLVPQVSVGPTSSSRIGQKIRPTKIRVHCQYYFDNAATTGSDCFIRQYVATSKEFKSKRALTNAAQQPLLTKMMDNGDDTTSIPNPGANPLQLTYPLERESFTALKGSGTFHITKNTGLPFNASIGALSGNDPLATVASSISYAFDVKPPKTLLYEHNDSYPSNFNPLMGVAACNFAVGGSAQSYPSQQGSISLGVPANPILKMRIRTEMWYKDS